MNRDPEQKPIEWGRCTKCGMEFRNYTQINYEAGRKVCLDAWSCKQRIAQLIERVRAATG